VTREDGRVREASRVRPAEKEQALQVLLAVRRALTGRPTASATVLLDGRESELQAE
jgi:hypothetical protein